MNRRFDRQTYERIYQPGLVKLRDGLQEWNAKANALASPYKKEVERLTQMIDYWQKSVAGGASEFCENTSLETDRFLHAAACLSIYMKEREITEGRASGYPSKVLQAMEADLAWMRTKSDVMKDVEPSDVLWALIPNPNAQIKDRDPQSTTAEAIWDVFVSHATEEEPFVRQLAEVLQAAGLKVWYDRFTLRVGDSLRRSIDEGLARSKFGIVVLSPYFFAKEWPQRELDGLVAREIEGRKVILPVWHNIDVDEVRRFSPPLADRVAVKSSAGLDKVAEELLRAIAGHD